MNKRTFYELKIVAFLLMLFFVTAIADAKGRPHRHRRAHVANVLPIPDYSPWQQFYRRCAEVKTAPAPPGETEEARAIRLQAPLIQDGEDARRPINLDLCK